MQICNSPQTDNHASTPPLSTCNHSKKRCSHLIVIHLLNCQPANYCCLSVFNSAYLTECCIQSQAANIAVSNISSSLVSVHSIFGMFVLLVHNWANFQNTLPCIQERKSWKLATLQSWVVRCGKRREVLQMSEWDELSNHNFVNLCNVYT